MLSDDSYNPENDAPPDPFQNPDAMDALERTPPPKDRDVMICVKDISKSFGGHSVLKNVSLQVYEHETVGIIGLSGCGKSTLLRIISGLETADSGEVKLFDPHYSLVFQYSALFDSLSVFENVAFSLLEKADNTPEGDEVVLGCEGERHKQPKKRSSKQPGMKRPGMKKLREIVSEKLRMVGLEGIEDEYPNSLSGGMKKRVSFARAIVNNPRIILYDEPTAGLDPIASTMIEDYMMSMRNELSAASVVVTHQFSTINRTDRIILLHEGEVHWEGTPRELHETDNPYAQQFAHASLEGPMTLEHA
jgi:phospholipid/cholesterol/gamma-HCH transport system ATP-binding protein